MMKRTLFALLVCGQLAVAAQAAGQDPSKEAGAHFQRALSLYQEADYRGALAEFRRANEIAPNVNVLYNIGQAAYQLQDYAQALANFERYVAEGGTTHRAEVERTLTVLRTRIGKVDLSASLSGAELFVDDESVGHAPLAKPLTVNVGKHRVAAAKEGHATVARTVEVTAGDTKAVSLIFDTIAGAGNALGAPVTVARKDPKPEADSSLNVPAIATWSAAGALAVGGTITGVLAISSANDLSDYRRQVPANQPELDRRARATTTLGLVTDVLVISAVVAAGVALYLTLSHSSPKAVGKTPFVLGGSF